MRAAVVAVTAVALVAVGCAGGTGSTVDAGPVPDTDTPGQVSTSASNPGDAGSQPGGDTSAPSSTGSAGPSRCHTAELTASLRPQGAATGNRYATLVLTNHTSRTCRIYGYGGLQLLDAQHRAIPTEQDRDTLHPPTLVAVAPGHSASAVLHWGAVPSGGEPENGPCEPEPSFLSVIPPDETTALVVDWSLGSVCQRGRIDQSAYQAGVVTP